VEILNKDIAGLGTRRTYRRNAFLFLAGEDARGFFYILKGEVRVFRMDDAGKELEIVRLRPGDFFGEAIAFLDEKFPAFARAAQDSEVLFFEKQAVFQTLETDSTIARFFLLLLARKCRVLNQRIETLGLRTVRQRLAQYLLSLCRDGQTCRIELSIKKLELARQLGTISETLSRNFRKLEEEGLIAVRKKTITVKSVDRLREAIKSFSIRPR
jgi:CRP-like cAMP-binding protein